MYIPIWIIITGVIIWVVYLSSKSKKINMNMTQKQNFSYKLDIHIEPNWREIYKKASGKSKEIIIKEIEKKIKLMEKEESTSGLYGRRYFFTEYYDSVSGLVTRFQRIFQGEKQYFYPVDEFGDQGYFFDSDSGLNAPFEETEEQRDDREKLSVQVGENFIRNNIWDKYVGGLRSGLDYAKENYLFSFPSQDIFNFLFSIGQRFHGAEENTIIKWPDHIEKKFKELGIKYETYFDFEPTEFSIKEHDEELFEKLGKPKITLGSSDRFHSGALSQNNSYFSIKLKLFRPNENDRVDIANLN